MKKFFDKIDLLIKKDFRMIDVKKVLIDLYDNKYTYLWRGLLLQLGITSCGGWLLSLVFRSLLVSSDLPGITTDNIGSFFANPLSIGLLAIYLFILAFLVYVEFSLLVAMLQTKELGIKCRLRYLRQEISYFLTSISGWNGLFFVLYLMLTLPFLRYLFTSALLENLYIPQFIPAELMKTQQGLFFYGVSYLVLAYLNLRLIYTLPLVVLGKGRAFKSALTESWHRTKGRRLLDLAGLVLTLFLLSSGLWLMVSVLLWLAKSQLFQNHYLMEIILVSAVGGLMFMVSLIWRLGSLSYLLQRLEISHQVMQTSKKKYHWFLFILAIFSLGASSLLYNRLQLAPKQADYLAVFAHRGDVSQGVENSLDSLEAAAKAGADYAEIDVIYSEDHHFIVSHDNNLKRLTDQDIKISESNASELIGMTIKQNGHRSQLVDLSTYIDRAKELNIKLLIELKLTGQEDSSYLSNLVQLLKDKEVIKQFPVMSLKLPVIENLEKLAPDIETGYTIPLQIGDFTSQVVDFYAIEEFSYNEWLAEKAHKKNKKIYVWTINTSDKIDKFLQTSADGLITDYTSLVKDKQKKATQSDSYFDYLVSLIDF